jgi:hypothetical protein
MEILNGYASCTIQFGGTTSSKLKYSIRRSGLKTISISNDGGVGTGVAGFDLIEKVG